MDWELLNAIGITIMAALGLWAFQRAHAKMENHPKSGKRN